MNKSLNLYEIAEIGQIGILVNAKHEAVGILIPLKKWPKIASSVDKSSELHRLMEKLTFKPIFERSLKEQGNWLRSEVEQVESHNLKKGLYNIYQDEEYCASKDVFIHQYADHRELVRIDATTGNTKTIKQAF